MAKRKNAQDATLRLTRPLRRDVDDLKKRIKVLEKAVAKLTARSARFV